MSRVVQSCPELFGLVQKKLNHKPGRKSRHANPSQAQSQDKLIQARPKVKASQSKPGPKSRQETQTETETETGSRQVDGQRQTNRQTKRSIEKEKRKKIKMQSEIVACGGPIRSTNIGRFGLAPAFGFGICDTS